jgi:cell division protein ZapA
MAQKSGSKACFRGCRVDDAMSEGAKTIEVSLLGRTYRVACDDDERESLMQAVAYLDGKMNEIRKAGKVMGAERIAVMAALNVAHELLSVRLGAGFDVGQAKRRISAIESKIDAAIAKQENLF